MKTTKTIIVKELLNDDFRQSIDELVTVNCKLSSLKAEADFARIADTLGTNHNKQVRDLAVLIWTMRQIFVADNSGKLVIKYSFRRIATLTRVSKSQVGNYFNMVEVLKKYNVECMPLFFGGRLIKADRLADGSKDLFLHYMNDYTEAELDKLAREKKKLTENTSESEDTEAKTEKKAEAEAEAEMPKNYIVINGGEPIELTLEQVAKIQAMFSIGLSEK